MTLKEFLNMKVLRDNIKVRCFKADSIGLGDYVGPIVDVIRIMGRPVEINDLLTHGMPSEWLDLEIREIRGADAKFKTYVIVEAK